MANYNYSVTVDFVSSSYPSLCELHQEITGSSISTAELLYINRAGSSVDIYFQGTLSVPDEAILDSIVAAHQGTQSLCVDAIPVLSDGTIIMSASFNMGGYNITNVGTVDGVDVSNHSILHEQTGSDEIDGDHLDIDFTPTYYSPNTGISEADNVDQLAAHLFGIDQAIYSASTADWPSGSLSQDLSGTLPNGYVTGLYGIPLTGAASADGQFYVYDASDNKWNLALTTSIPVQTHASTHIQGGTDEIDGDQIDIDFNPTGYTPVTTPSEVTSIDHLSAHLAGISNALSGGEIFGKYFDEGSSTASFSTTRDVFQEAFTKDIGAAPSGKYRIGWNYIWSMDSINEDIEVRIQVDNTTTIHFHREEPKEAGGTGFGATSQLLPVGGFAYAQLTSGSHTIDLDVRSTRAGKEAAIHSASIEFWRVS